MSETCPIVTIETENGPVDINEADYDPSKHRLVGEVEKKVAEDKPKRKYTKRSK